MSLILRFEYDPDKAARKLLVHGVSFDEAATGFFDQNALSEGESCPLSTWR